VGGLNEPVQVVELPAVRPSVAVQIGLLVVDLSVLIELDLERLAVPGRLVALELNFPDLRH
jgi:hypothetical protein